MIRWWLRLQRLKWRERRLEYQLDLYPDENLYPVLEFVRYARAQAEKSYPPTRDGSR